MSSIVKELSDWLTENEVSLSARGIQIVKRCSAPSAQPGKAGLGLAYGEFLVSFTVWELTVLQTELIIMNGATKKTIFVEDKKPSDPSAIRSDLNDVVQKLLSNYYVGREPDPKLLSSR